jgi:hypothetical protein
MQAAMQATRCKRSLLNLQKTIHAFKGMRLLIWLVTLVSAAINPLLARSQDKLKVISRTAISPDLFCNPEGQATGNLILRNDGTAAVPIHLSAGDLSSKSPAKHLTIQPALAPKDTSLGPKQELTVQATVAKLYEDGDWESTIQNDGVDVGTLRVVRTTPSFSLGLDVATPDTPELTFVKGKPAYFRLKNADPREYQVAWEYSVNGRIVRSRDPGAMPGPIATIPAGGQQEVSFVPPPEWFGGRFVGLFKDEIADGRLTVSLVDPNSKCTDHSPVSKTFKVKTHLATSSGSHREGWANFWVFVFLTLGGIFSLGLNSLLPNQMRRMKIKEQLSKLGARISNLSYDLASRLRVLAGMEVRLIKDRLKNLTWTSTDFAGEIQSIEQATDRLGTRLNLLEQLGTTRTNFTKVRFDVLPPSMIFAVEQKFEKIVEISQKTDLTAEGVQMAEKLVKEIQDQLDRGIQGNDDFAKSLAAQMTKFKAEFDTDSGRIGKTETCKRIRTAFPGPFDRLCSTDKKTITAVPNGLSAQDYIDLDGRLFELALIRDYVDFVEGLAPTNDWRKKVIAHEGQLLRYLRLCSCEAMYAARLLFRQMKDGFFKEDIQTEIETSMVRIKVDRGAIRQYAPSEFRLEFLKLALNNASARQEWTCRWAFTLGEQKPGGQKPDDERLIEEGWAVTHYFQDHTKYKVKITLTHNMDGTKIEVPDVELFPQGEIDVLPEERRRFGQAINAALHWRWSDARKAWRNRRHTSKRLDYLRLAMTLVIALFGLMAGAKEQLLKLDVLPALLAIFMVGFGADQIKNLLTQKPPADTSTHR